MVIIWILPFKNLVSILFLISGIQLWHRQRSPQAQFKKGVKNGAKEWTPAEILCERWTDLQFPCMKTSSKAVIHHIRQNGISACHIREDGSSHVRSTSGRCAGLYSLLSTTTSFFWVSQWSVAWNTLATDNKLHCNFSLNLSGTTARESSGAEQHKQLSEVQYLLAFSISFFGTIHHYPGFSTPLHLLQHSKTSMNTQLSISYSTGTEKILGN